MNLDEKTIAEIAKQLGLKEEPTIRMEDVKRLQGKSDAQLESEILRIRESLAARGVSRQKQVAMLRSLLPMMDMNQRARLRKAIELIEGRR